MRLRMRGRKVAGRFSSQAPSASFAPTVLSRDIFTGTNGTSLASHTPNSGSPTWSVAAGTFTIQTNKAKGGTTGTNIAVMNLGQTSFTIQADLVIGTSLAVGLIFRYADSSNFLEFVLTGGNFLLQSNATSGNNSLGTVSAGGATSGTARIICNGNLVVCCWNGAPVIVGSDTVLTANTQAGLIAVKAGSAPDATLDNYQVTKP